MILVDTSVWVDHLRNTDERMKALLDADDVLMHPFVLGEIALGNLPQRGATLDNLQTLRQAVVAHNDEVLALIEGAALWGLGIGYVDTHLLASARLTPDCQLWTRDRRLGRAVDALGLAPKLH